MLNQMYGFFSAFVKSIDERHDCKILSRKKQLIMHFVDYFCLLIDDLYTFDSPNST